MPDPRYALKCIEHVTTVVKADRRDTGNEPGICDLLRSQRVMQSPGAPELLQPVL
jgi:hypothetical protein